MYVLCVYGNDFIECWWVVHIFPGNGKKKKYEKSVLSQTEHLYETNVLYPFGQFFFPDVAHVFALIVRL